MEKLEPIFNDCTQHLNFTKKNIEKMGKRKGSQKILLFTRLSFAVKDFFEEERILDRIQKITSTLGSRNTLRLALKLLIVRSLQYILFDIIQLRPKDDIRLTIYLSLEEFVIKNKEKNINFKLHEKDIEEIFSGHDIHKGGRILRNKTIKKKRRNM
jgi:hypothetical protein